MLGDQRCLLLRLPLIIELKQGGGGGKREGEGGREGGEGRGNTVNQAQPNLVG